MTLYAKNSVNTSDINWTLIEMREKDGQTSYQCLPKPGFTCVVLPLFLFFAAE